MVVKDEVFDTIGIEENNLHYYCCDDQAFDVCCDFSLLSIERKLYQPQQIVGEKSQEASLFHQLH